MLTASFVHFSQERTLSLQSLPSFCSQGDVDNTGVLACVLLGLTLLDTVIPDAGVSDGCCQKDQSPHRMEEKM